MNWRPIETAPKDGTEVLLFNNLVYVGNYDSEYDSWWSSRGLDEISPTHWMPLPSDPHEE